MKILSLVSLAMVLTASSNAQKTIHDPNAELRSLKGYHAVKVSTGIDLYLSHGEEAVAVSGTTAEDRANIITRVEDGVLKISYNWKEGKNLFSSSTGKRLKAYVSYKNLDAISASAGSDVAIEGVLKADKLSINISGGSDLKGKLDVQDLKVDASAGSDINITGRANKVDIDVSGGSDFDGFGFETETAVIDASGGSDVELTVNKELKVNSSGASDVTYKGNGVIKEIKSGSASSVKKLGK